MLKDDTFYGASPKKEQTKSLDTFDKITREYSLSRDSNLKDQTWRRQMADFMSQVNRPHMKSFLEKKGFFLQ